MPDMPHDSPSYIRREDGKDGNFYHGDTENTEKMFEKDLCALCVSAVILSFAGSL